MQTRFSSRSFKTVRRCLSPGKLLLLVAIGILVVFQMISNKSDKTYSSSIHVTATEELDQSTNEDSQHSGTHPPGGQQREVNMEIMATVQSLWSEHPYQGVRLNDAKTDFEIEDAFSSYAIYKQIDCPLKERYGHWKDGGWDICVTPPFGLSEDNCIVYSFGIGLDWSFDDALAKRKRCEIYSFDPTIGKKRHKRGDYIHFFDIGLEDKNRKNSSKGFETKTFDTIIKENGHTNKIIDMLKVDIEGSEWAVIPNMFKTGMLHNIKQLAMEIHTFGRNTSIEFYKRAYRAMEMLDKAGFRRYYSEPNDHCRYFSPFDTGRRPVKRWGCYNVYYININFVK
ncbi:unnamed protein product [Owenia fusiformis]|uniref:Methyltransferase domain-containing protein n=1 Tax=Owenia fusiformis TaxID=6347 RepID=A0A8S4P1Q3_OWEFU|nr:unnamed protein product [Owenia fusiformis]